MKILVIEDNRDLQKELKAVLQKEGYEIVIAGGCKEALDSLHNTSVDLCLMDIGLPDGSGFDLCREVRRFYKNPIIMLTSYDGEEDIIKGLDSGADDYVPKPFSIGILCSRIASQLRRKSWEEQKEYQVFYSGDLKLDFKEQKFWRNLEAITLSTTEMRLCEILIRNAGRLVQRDILLQVWDSKNNYVENNTLSVNISRLRRSLSKYEGKDYIETVKGVGYRWNIEVRKN